MNKTKKVLVGVVVGISTALLVKKIYNIVSAKRLKQQNQVKLNKESLNNIEKLLVELKTQYPNECFLDIDGTKVILLNSIEAIRQYSTQFGDNLIANRPHFELFDLISHNYLGSFFRMYDDNLVSIRKNSSIGLNRLVMNNPEFELKLFDELRMFEEFLQNQNELDNFPIYIQQFTANALISVGLGTRFDYSTSSTSTIREQIENMNSIFSSINVLKMVEKSDEATKSLVGKLVNKAYDFLQGALKGYLPQYNSQTINTFADFLLSKQEDIKKIRDNLNKHDAYSDDDILVQFFTVFMAGSISLGFAASWVFYYLATNPQIQQNILSEVESLNSDNDEFISIKMRPKMLYVEAFIDEALRLASVQPLIPRATLKQIKTNQLKCDKDTIVLYNVYGMQHDEAYWPESNICKPERWLSEDKNTLSLAKSSYLPFGNSPRKCIGEALSKNILFSMVVNMAKKFQFKPIDQSINEVKAKVGVMRCPSSFKVSLAKNS